jgi:glutathione synthase
MVVKIVMIITFPSENNLFDQRAVEFDLWQRHSIKCIRKTLTDVYHEATLGSGRDLIISGVKCAVAYFRAGYTPDDYPSEKEWQARLLIEKSTASCCPSVAYQLVGTKKLQQCLASPGVLEQFLSDSKMIEKIRSTFAGLYSLDKTSEGDQAIEMALRDPERFVLKPQREGGGNNFYGDSLREKLSEVRNSSERTAYILMDRIQSPSQDGLVLRPKPHTLELEPEPVISEVGIFGMYVRRADRVLLNTSAGHLVRTKPLSANEGGVLMGTSALDSPSLLTTDEFISRIINQE